MEAPLGATVIDTNEGVEGVVIVLAVFPPPPQPASPTSDATARNHKPIFKRMRKSSRIFCGEVTSRVLLRGNSLIWGWRRNGCKLCATTGEGNYAFFQQLTATRLAVK